MSSTQTALLEGVTASLAVKAPVRAATTGPITLAGLQTIDGVTLAERDRVLVKDQADAIENGVYNAASGDWVRSPDFNGSRDAVGGTIFLVVKGGVNSNTYWRVNADGSVTFDQDEIDIEAALLTDSAVAAFVASGTGVAARTAQAKMRDGRSTADKSGNFTAQVGAWITDLATGGKVRGGAGALTMTAGVAVNRDCFALEGDGRTSSIINPNFGGTVFDFDKGGGGTIYQGKLKAFAFSSAEASNKTLVHAKNAANMEFAELNVAEGAILGSGSIGFLVEGRELNWFHDNIMAVASPMKVIQNPLASNISTDYMVVEREHYIAQSAAMACITFDEGVYLSNTTIRDSALVKGKQGIFAKNTTLAASSYCASVVNTRREQSQDATAFSYEFNYLTKPLLNFVFGNNLADITQKGFYGRGIQRAFFYADILPQTGAAVAMDYTIPSAGSLTMIECQGGAGGTRTLADAHTVLKAPSRVANDPIGSFEHHVYFPDTARADPGGGGLYNFEALPTLEFGGVPMQAFRLTLPAGSRNIRIGLCVTAAMVVDAYLTARAANGHLEGFWKKDGTFDILTATGIFASTATGGKIYPMANGLTADTLAAPTTISVEVRQ